MFANTTEGDPDREEQAHAFLHTQFQKVEVTAKRWQDEVASEVVKAYRERDKTDRRTERQALRTIVENNCGGVWLGVHLEGAMKRAVYDCACLMYGKHATDRAAARMTC